MNPTTQDVTRAVDTAKVLQQQGYFTKVKQGDERAASYFARLTAQRVNPTGNPRDWGWLAKGGGFNIEGFADGAIVFGNDPADRQNVLKLVLQVGSSNPNDIQIASTSAALQPRRESDVWASPVSVPDSILMYLLNGGQPLPIEPPKPLYPSYEALGGDEGGKKITRILEADYKRAGMRGLDGDCGAWQQRVSYDFLTGICKTVEAAIAKHREEWCQTLGISVE